MASRGRGGGPRGGSRGRGGNAATGGASGVPLAAQMRQVQRLDEPKEMALFRRFKSLDPVTVESVYGPTGLLETKLRVSRASLRPFWGLQVPGEASTFTLSLVQCENVLRSIEAHETRERALSRREARLQGAKRQASWSSLSDQDKEVLLLSNAEYRKRFPTVSGNGGVAVGDGAKGS